MKKLKENKSFLTICSISIVLIVGIVYFGTTNLTKDTYAEETQTCSKIYDDTCNLYAYEYICPSALGEDLVCKSKILEVCTAQSGQTCCPAETIPDTNNPPIENNGITTYTCVKNPPTKICHRKLVLNNCSQYEQEGYECTPDGELTQSYTCRKGGAGDNQSGGNSSGGNSSGGNPSGGNNNQTNNNTNNNAEQNPQTGNIVIFIVWITGFIVLGYSAYYFKSLKKQ